VVVAVVEKTAIGCDISLAMTASRDTDESYVRHAVTFCPDFCDKVVTVKQKRGMSVQAMRQSGDA
jgi:hypothetical protein